MPWYRTKHVIPPANQEITTFNNGVRETKSYGPGDILDGTGKLNTKFPPWWSRLSDLPPPPEEKDTGINHFAPVQEEVLQPKIVDGIRPPKGPEVRAEGAWDQR